MGSRNDYLGHSYEGRALPSFSVNPGGYIGYYDPQSGQHQKYYENGDTVAIERLAVKQQLGLARRSVRYEFRTSTNLPITSGLRQFI
jgi:hypothetical protein